MSAYSENHTINDIVLSAINYGNLYAEHCVMGQCGAPDSEWEWHVATKVVPQWVREGGTGCKYSYRKEIARLLKAYYREHVLELDRA